MNNQNEDTYSNRCLNMAYLSFRPYSFNYVVCVLSIAAAGILLPFNSSGLGEETNPLPCLKRIRVDEAKAHFVSADSVNRFFPWGFNYLGKFEHLAEDDWDTDEGWTRIEKDFHEMRELGANVVRWHLQFETFIADNQKPKQSQLDRLRKLLKLANSNQIYLNLTGLNCFRKDKIPAWYNELSESDRWRVQATFWESIAETCKDDTAIFCYDLMNEPVINTPGKGEHPWVGGELGGFCFVQRICNQLDERDTLDVAEAWVKMMVNAIRKHDEESLITVGVIPWAFVWPNAKPVFYSPQVAKHLDFASIHIYPQTGKRDSELKALQVYDVGLPLVIEEIFPMNCTIDEIDKFIDRSDDRVDGWISHYFGSTPQEHLAGAQPAGALVAEFLEYWKKKRSKWMHTD